MNEIGFIQNYWYLANIRAINDEIWPICPYMGIRFLTITRSFFGQSSSNFIWQLKRLLSIDWCWEIWIRTIIFKFRILGPNLAQKKSVVPHSAIRVSDLKTQPISWPKVRSFWIMYYLKSMLPKNFDLHSPLNQSTNPSGLILQHYLLSARTNECIWYTADLNFKPVIW